LPQVWENYNTGDLIMKTITSHDALVAAIRELVAYNWPTERRDYHIQEEEGCNTQNHIYHTLLALDAWTDPDPTALPTPDHSA
jgi:hypothetical protein